VNATTNRSSSDNHAKKKKKNLQHKTQKTTQKIQEKIQAFTQTKHTLRQHNIEMITCIKTLAPPPPSWATRAEKGMPRQKKKKPEGNSLKVIRRLEIKCIIVCLLASLH
jgi:hypothetical protein